MKLLFMIKASKIARFNIEQQPLIKETN